MRKTLLIAAAALAASVISSQAQVYSQNIVGYVNTPLPTGFVNIANPLDASGSNNSITNVINVFSGTYDGAGIYIWNGAGYSQYTIDSGWSSGIGNAADTAQVNPPPTLAPGVGIFINNTTGNSNTLTFVGTVLIDSAGASTNVVGIVTNHLATGFTFVASKLPIAGGLNSVMQLPVASTLLDGAGIYVPNIFGGAVHGFFQYTVDSGWSSGFGNAADTAMATEPIIPVGTGFFINNTTGSAVNWVQSL